MGRAAPLALALALASCAHHRPALDAVPPACRGDLATDACAAWVVDRVLALSQTTYVDEDIAAYVASVGQRIVRALGDRRRWSFVVSDDTSVQAYAGLSTTVFVHRGTLALLRDEAELAGVLAHEVAHVLGGHARENLRDVLLGGVQRSAESERHADRFARDDEIQADEVAVLALAQAHYDPGGVERMLRALAVTSPGDGADDTAHHPRWIERVARVQALSALLPAGEANSERFLARMAGLVLGDDPRVATLVGDVAVFAHANLALDLPPHRSVEQGASEIMVQIDDDSGVGIRAVDPRIAHGLVEKLATEPDATFAVVERPHRSLIIAAVGSDAKRVVRDVRGRLRAPTAAELRAIVPPRVDFRAPRVMWSP